MIQEIDFWNSSQLFTVLIYTSIYIMLEGLVYCKEAECMNVQFRLDFWA
jgi:hypothetical protein